MSGATRRSGLPYRSASTTVLAVDFAPFFLVVTRDRQGPTNP
jgi:hypothetical protein